MVLTVHDLHTFIGWPVGWPGIDKPSSNRLRHGGGSLDSRDASGAELVQVSPGAPRGSGTFSLVFFAPPSMCVCCPLRRPPEPLAVPDLPLRPRSLGDPSKGQLWGLGESTPSRATTASTGASCATAPAWSAAAPRKLRQPNPLLRSL